MQEFTQQVEDTIRAAIGEMHTALPGIIMSFDSEKCIASVKPAGKYTTSEGNRMEYPQLPEVPVVFPYSIAAGAGIVFPVKPGDGCLVVISEVELDEWRSGAEAEGTLKYDLTNAICIPGLFKTGGELIVRAMEQNAVIIASGNTQLSLSEAGIAISGDLKVNGNISSTGSIKAGKIDLQQHVHKSSEPGNNTGKPE